MPGKQLSSHTRDVLTERNIPEDWVWQTVNAPDKTWRGADGNFHFAKRMHEKHRRILHVVLDDATEPQIIVTVFFDRRLQI